MSHADDENDAATEEPADPRTDWGPHAELHGRLLMANERLDRAARGCGWFTVLAWFVGVTLVMGGFLDDLVARDLEALRSIWFYFIFGLVCFASWWRWDDWRKTALYRSALRDAIVSETSRAGFTQATLLDALAADGDLERISDEIKADDEFDRRRRVD